MIEITLRTKKAGVRRTSTKARKILVMRAKKMRMAKRALSLARATQRMKILLKRKKARRSRRRSRASLTMTSISRRPKP